MSDPTVELLIDGGWTEVPAFEAEGWEYKVGPSNVTGIEPNSLGVTLNNDDLSLDPSNVASPLYKKIGLNTPARLLLADKGGVTAADTFDGRTVASGWGTSSGGQVWTTSGGAASDYAVSSGLGRFTLTSINVSRRATLPGTVTGGEALAQFTIDIDPTGDDIETTIMFQYQDASNYIQASIYWDRDGRPIELQFVRRVAGVVTQLGITHLKVSPTDAAFSCWLKVRWFRNQMTMKVWPSAAAEPFAWSLSAVDATWSSGQVGIRANLQPLFSAGVPRLVTVDNFSLKAYSADVLCTGEASSWKPSSTVEHVPGARKGRAQVDLTADGLLRRLGRWEESSRSPMARQISSYDSLLGYWPMEDAAGAQNLANELASGAPGYFTGDVELSGDDGAAGALSALVLQDGAAIGGAFQFDATTDGYQLCWLMKLDAVPTSAAYIAFMQWSDTMGRTWYWRINQTGFEIATYDEFSTLISSTTVAFAGFTDVTQWVRYRMKVSVTGSTVKYEPAWYSQDAVTTYGTSATFTNVSVGYPKYWRSVGNAYTDGAAFGHMFGVSDLTLDIVGGYDAQQAFNAYNGETALARYVRLMVENKLSYRVWGTNSLSPIMGRQPRGSLVSILENIQATDGGIMYDETDRSARLVFAMNNYLVAQTPVLALTKGIDVGYPLLKVIDDLGAANDLTVTNWDGTEVRLEQKTGPRSTQSPPAGVGRYQGKLDVSFAYLESLAQRGNWELALNTNDKPRFPTVTIDLLANPGLRATVAALRPGNLITIAGELPDLITLMVVQINRKGGQIRDTVSLECVSGEMFQPGKYNDVALWDSKSTTTSGTMTTTGTSMAIKTTEKDAVWRTSGPYDVLVEGERITVNFASAAVFSGGTYNQAMNVTRSVNGVVKTHSPGEEVHVFKPLRYIMKLREPI